MKKENEAIKRLRDNKSKVSSHYFIRRNGGVLNLVPDLYSAWHAGVSDWKNFDSLNLFRINSKKVIYLVFQQYQPLGHCP